MGAAWGFSTPTFSNGAAYGDLDNDGDLDMVVNNENQPAFIYKNNSREINKNNYIGLSLTGKGKNTFAIGSKIKLFAGGQILTRELVPSRGFQSSVDYKIIIGLGSITQADSMIITWPDRSYSIFQNPELNKVHTIREPDEKKMIPDRAVINPPTFFSEEKNNFDKHQENEVIDFYTERNIPRLLSREGPKAAAGDVNADGLEDVFIGGTPGHPGQLYLQKADGSFGKKEEKAFQQFNDFEDAAVLLFDCDNDGDPDLLVCPGGNNARPNSRELQLRLFRNDGQGNFSIDEAAFPNTGMNISVAIANDFTGDGFPDLFVGARSYPQLYGADPESFLFVNDGKGHFTDMAKTKNPDIAKIGMVCNAIWADVAGDAKKELIIVGEWMSPRIFTYKDGHFDEIKTNLDQLSGWWQTVTATDVNMDGKQDLILGNMGENFYLQPDSDKPLKLWINDFDQNNSIEKIITSTIDGKDMPVVLKRELEDQLPSIKKSNLKNEAYANKPVQQLFSKEVLSKALVKKINYTSSCVAINTGNGNFIINKLPPMAQLSCINVVYANDLNGDGFPDLVLGGNQFGFIPQFERLDASLGDVLMNDKKGNFTWMDAVKTGLHIRGEVRDIVPVKTRNGNFSLLILQNNDFPLLYKPGKLNNMK